MHVCTQACMRVRVLRRRRLVVEGAAGRGTKEPGLRRTHRGATRSTHQTSLAANSGQTQHTSPVTHSLTHSLPSSLSLSHLLSLSLSSPILSSVPFLSLPLPSLCRSLVRTRNHRNPFVTAVTANTPAPSPRPKHSAPPAAANEQPSLPPASSTCSAPTASQPVQASSLALDTALATRLPPIHPSTTMHRVRHRSHSPPSVAKHSY